MDEFLIDSNAKKKLIAWQGATNQSNVKKAIFYRDNHTWWPPTTMSDQNIALSILSTEQMTRHVFSDELLHCIANLLYRVKRKF